ncbi:MAG: tetratricopeptide repeat protein, partial [Phormidesmis sp. CAN_BIN44]|nr:tetratricopeptide repeat protein [Phormidesmis sp. CAN_BIN44]
DYRTAAKLLKEFLRESPQNPFGQFYRGRLCEVSGKLEAAEEIYRQLLRDVVNPKIAGQARQGIQRLEALAQTRQQTAIAAATADPQNAELGMLVLEAISSDIRTTSAQSFARIMNLDAYTARLQLPNRGWRLYRTGAIGELQHYGQQLRKAEIPAFWAPLKALQNLQVFQVQYFQSYQPNATAICQNDQDQLGSLSFDWAEVTQRVEGRLPIFEQVVDTDARQRTQRQRKEQTQDYAHICDLHLPKRRCILRLCDLNYQFPQGIAFSTTDDNTIRQPTNRIHWNHLLAFLNYQLPEQPVWSEFMPFAETAIEFPNLLKRLKSHVHLFGQDTSPWNPVFHLYSGLAFSKDL